MLLQTRQLSYRYTGSAELRFPDFSVQASEHWLITGESGSGKTTLLHLLGGLLQPSSGELYWKDSPLKDYSSAALDRWRGRHIGLVFQQPHFVRSLSLEENLMLPAWCSSQSSDRAKLKEIAQRLDLEHSLRKTPNRLSAGEQQRASIARALMQAPQLLLADEPTSALDDRRCDEVIALLKRESQLNQTALIIVTHDARVKEQFSNIIQLVPINQTQVTS